jgi:DNA-binding transcriptional LysR family regulator
MDFRELAYIVSIAKHQGVGKAAEEVHITQPTLSKFVQNLENYLGQPLFRRLGNKFLLTYAGKRYVETAKSMLEMKKGLDHEHSDIIKNNVGEMKTAVPPMRGLYLLSRALPVFWEQFPLVKVTVNEASSTIMNPMLLNGDIDLAFFTLAGRHPDLDYEIISQEEVVLVMSPDHPMANQGITKKGCKYPWMDIRKLEGEQFFLQWPDQKIRQMTDKVFHDAGIKPTIKLTTRNIFASVQLATAGHGMTFVGEISLQYIQTNVKPVCFSVGNPNMVFDFVVAFRRGIYLPSYIQQFIGIVKEVDPFRPV